METSTSLRFSADKEEPFLLPLQWNRVNPPEDGGVVRVASVEEMAQTALAKAKDAPSLQEIASRGKRGLIAIIVDDSTRPTPVKRILSVLLGELSRLGVPADHITIVVALGSHRRLSEEELRERLGGEVVLGYSVIQHNAWDDNLVPLENSKNGMLVRVNPHVARADAKIGISSILPHPFAGYGGGPKILMPGVCDVESLARHHMIRAVHPHARIGVTEGNPFHESCMEIALAIGLDLSINCVYDKNGLLAGIAAGGLSGAFHEAVNICRSTLGCDLKEKVDVTISSTYPHTHGIQFFKGLCTPRLITKETGAILLYVPLAESLPDEFVRAVASLRARYGDGTAVYINRVMSGGHLVFDDKSPEYNMAMYDFLGRPMPRTLLVSKVVSCDIAEKLGFEYVPSVDEGVRRLKESYPVAQVAVFSSGGLVVPIVRT